MSKYLFKTFCPACNEGKITSWCHDSKTCGGDYYIDEDLYLHCDKCNHKIFIFNTTFDCGKHDLRKPIYQHYLAALAILQQTSDVPVGILKKMIKKAK